MKGKKGKKWLWVLLGVGCLLIIGGILAAIPRSEPVEVEKDVPQFSQDEVIAIVKNVLGQRIYRYTTLEIYGDVKYSAAYEGQGKWSGLCVIRWKQDEHGAILPYASPKPLTPEDIARRELEEEAGIQPYDYEQALYITWNFYEKSQTTEIVRY